MNKFIPNLDPEPADPEEFAYTSDPAAEEAINEIIDDTTRDYCQNCNGSAVVIKFGKKLPCPVGIKILRKHPPRIVCYEPDGAEPT